MDLKSLFNLKGINFWVLGVGIGWNLVWTVIALITALGVLERGYVSVDLVQIALIVIVFIMNLLTGMLTAWMAADGRGPTYGVVSSISSAFALGAMLLTTGVIGIMTMIVALAGGLNGGLLSQRRQMK